jgi:hypothetical protein
MSGDMPGTVGAVAGRFRVVHWGTFSNEGTARRIELPYLSGCGKWRVSFTGMPPASSGPSGGALARRRC